MDAAGAEDARAEIVAAVEELLAGREPPQPGATTRAPWFPIAALSGLAALDHAHGYVLAVLAPEIGTALGAGAGAVALVLFVRVVGSLLGLKGLTALMPALVSKGRCLEVAAVGGLAWSLAAVVAGLAPALWALVATAFVYGLASATVPVVHPRALRAEAARSEVHRNAGRLGNVAAAALPGVVVAAGGDWRVAFIVAGCLSFPVAVAAWGARGRGSHRVDEDDRFAAALRRLAGVVLVRPLFVGMAVVAVVEVPMYAFFFTALDARWGMGAPGRALLAALLEAASVMISLVMVRRRSALVRVQPDQVLIGAASALLGGVAALVGFALAPTAAVGLICVVLTAAFLTPIVPLMWMGQLAIVASRRTGSQVWRELALVLAAGAVVLGAAGVVERMAGPAAPAWVMAGVLMVPAVLAVAAAVQLGSTVSSDRRSSEATGNVARASDSSSIASA